MKETKAIELATRTTYKMKVAFCSGNSSVGTIGRAKLE